MTTFTNQPWDSAYEATPPDTEDARLGAGRIRAFKLDTRERITVDHSFAGTADDGAHKKVTLLKQSVDPTTVANTGYLYTKDVAAITELFWRDSAGTVLQLTTNGIFKLPFTPSGNIAATTIYTALTELDAEKALLAGNIAQAFSASTLTANKVDAPINQNSKSIAYTTVLGDANQHLSHPATDNVARTFTIDSNANVAYPIGTTITFVNQINTLTIAITVDTLTLSGSGTVGSRTLNSSGMATALKVEATKWVISGSGLS